MPIVRTAKCNICGKEEAEAMYGVGWPGWMIVNGIALDGEDSVLLCPEHTALVATFIDQLKNGE